MTIKAQTDSEQTDSLAEQIDKVDLVTGLMMIIARYKLALEIIAAYEANSAAGVAERAIASVKAAIG